MGELYVCKHVSIKLLFFFNWTCSEYLYHRNWQTVQISPMPLPTKLVVKHLPAHNSTHPVAKRRLAGPNLNSNMIICP